MKKLLLALFLLGAFVAKAQLFAPPGAEWEYRYEWVFPQELYVSTFKYTGDTLYNGVNCQRVSRTPNSNIGGIDYYFYSDTSSIYYFHNFSSSFKKIFDYSLAIGDSLYLYHQVAALEGWSLCDSGFYAQIVGKGVDDINGTNYRYINYEPNFQYGFTGGKYYEKLGFLNGFFLNETICGINDGMYHNCLRLYRDNSSVDTLYNNRSACPVASDRIFVLPGAEWRYKYTPNGGSNNWELKTYKYTGDTIINNIICQRVVRPGDGNYYTNFFHSDNNTIYHYSKLYNVFYKLFDYTLSIGDSLPIYRVYETNDSMYYTHITDKGVENIEGQTYRWIEYTTPPAPEGEFFRSFKGRFYEKFGFKDNLFVPENEWHIASDGEDVYCLYDYNDDIDSIPHLNTFVLCDYTIGLEETPTPNFSLYPNPVVDGSFSVQSPKEVKLVELIDMIGQTVLSTTTINSPINTGHLAAGLYVARVIFANGAVGSKRIVVSY